MNGENHNLVARPKPPMNGENHNLVARPKPPMNGENHETSRSTGFPVDGGSGRNRRDPLVRRHATSIRCRTRPACRARLRDRRLRRVSTMAGLRRCHSCRLGRRTLAGAVIRRRFGSIRQLPSGRWQAAYSAPNGRRVLAPHTFAKRADAEAWLVDRRREIDAALWNPAAARPQRTQFAAYSTRWLANRDLRPRTRQTYKHILTRRLLPDVRRAPTRRHHPQCPRLALRAVTRQASDAIPVLRAATRDPQHRPI